TIVTRNVRYMQTRKDALIDALIAHLLERGLADLSLRPLAAATGTSARLLAEVLETMQTRLRQSFAQLLAPDTPERQPQPLKLLWQWATARRNYPYLKLLYELQILAIQSPDTYAQYLQRNASNWSDFILAMLPAPRRDPAFATLCAAVFDGLFLELMSTGDRKRTTQALDRFIRIAGDTPKRRAGA